jgi:cyclohexa-1,5-dienecarbonyl-CoA hydratase
VTYSLITTAELFDGQVTEITLGPAPANILSAQMMDELSAEMAKIEGAPHKKLVVFAGTGKHFSFGASVEEHTADKVGAMLPKFHKLIGRLLESPVPALAKVRGLCLGGAFELVLACPLLFCEEGAALGVPEIQLGVFPPAASILLPFKIGFAPAAQMILSGERVPAAELKRLGLVNEVAEAGKLDNAVQAFVEKHVLPKSAAALRLANQAAHSALIKHYREHIEEVERLYLDRLMSTADALEGIQAFLEKRPAKWKDQ